MDNEFLTNDEVAKLTGLKYSTLYTYRKRKTMPEPDTFIGRTPVWRKSTIQAWRKKRGILEEVEVVLHLKGESRKVQKSKPKRVDPKIEWKKEVKSVTLNHIKIEAYGVSTLAKAMNRPKGTILIWERNCYIPKAPLRTKSSAFGDRFYTKEMIISCVNLFKINGIYSLKRIDWPNHSNIFTEIERVWTDLALKIGNAR